MVRGSRLVLELVVCSGTGRRDGRSQLLLRKLQQNLQ